MGRSFISSLNLFVSVCEFTTLGSLQLVLELSLLTPNLHNLLCFSSSLLDSPKGFVFLQFQEIESIMHLLYVLLEYLPRMANLVNVVVEEIRL
jgi:hypothetical protein